MLNQVISFQSENSLSSASRIHPPVTNKCRHFSTGSCKLSHIYDGILPLLALCSMLLFLLFCLPLLTFTRNQIQQKVLDRPADPADSCDRQLVGCSLSAARPVRRCHAGRKLKKSERRFRL